MRSSKTIKLCQTFLFSCHPRTPFHFIITVNLPGRAAVTFFVSSHGVNHVFETQMTLDICFNLKSVRQGREFSNASPCKIYISISNTKPRRRSPAKGKDRNCKKKGNVRERVRVSKRFQDISSFRLEAVLETRCGGWWRCCVEVGSDLLR